MEGADKPTGKQKKQEKQKKGQTVKVAEKGGNLPTVAVEKPKAADKKSLLKLTVTNTEDKPKTETKPPERPLMADKPKAVSFADQRSSHKSALFSNLTRTVYSSHVLFEDIVDSQIHPVVQKFGLESCRAIFDGSALRLIKFLSMFVQLIDETKVVHVKALETALDVAIQFLEKCRPFSMDLETASKFLRYHVCQAKSLEELQSSIESFQEENTRFAQAAIADFTQERIGHNDVILIYDYQETVVSALVEAKQKHGLNFKVIVADSRPLYSATKSLERLVQANIPCTYVLITAVSYVLPEVTKLLLGAEGILGNGSVLASIGSSQLALLSKAFNVPVIICCETFKFSDHAVTDSSQKNELRSPSSLLEGFAASASPVKALWNQNSMLDIIDVAYDVVPPDLVSCVITELGVIPCTSVPYVVKRKHFWTDTSYLVS